MPECGGSNNAIHLTDDEAIRILTEPTAPDHFTVLRRRGRRPLSDEQIVQILQEDGPTDSIPPIPTAIRSEGVPLTLAYRSPMGNKRDAWALIATPPPPLRYRVIGAVLWLAVASVLVAIIYQSIAADLALDKVR